MGAHPAAGSDAAPGAPAEAAAPGQPWSPQRLRSNNEWLLLERLRACGSASRAQLARDTGLSKPTVSAALAALERAGLAREAGLLAPERGRVAVLYEPDPTAGYVLGIDIGRGRLRVAVADLAGETVARRDAPNRGRSADAVADAVIAEAHAAIAEAHLTPGDVVHAAIGTPGVWDEHEQRVHFARNLPGWGRRGLFDRIRSGLDTVISVHNDANLAALGEYERGAGAGSRLFVYLLIGTGLGLGVVSGGRLQHGAHGAAGEIGFLPMPMPMPMPMAAAGGADGVPGTLESVASAESVVRTAKSLGLRGASTARQVFDAARRGDPAALAAVEREADQLAYAVAVVSAVLDPDLVLLGGGVGQSADLLLGRMERTLHQLSPLRPRLAPSRLGEDAVLIGALATALRTARPTVFERRTDAVADRP
ncbi:ROK family transcriptional regulator [Saccharothrix sp. ST-888]|uniref:ROK family transcriptional regulator n=1 Tax=Saccharothrix sp. ST-888 TaxID=1427391 RepID=UPI00061E0DC3|nr:ROK family transcriptional regulator [Saccharothrix sp. ST-888]KJK59926.1 ROK family transcriptional regulator [Saccharothrix sp. ST-888]